MDPVSECITGVDTDLVGERSYTGRRQLWGVVKRLNAN